MSGARARVFHDEGEGAGLGHRRRMEVLGRALADLGMSVLPAGAESKDSGAADVLVVDSYRYRADDPAFTAPLVVAIDDLERDLAVDLMVDPNPGARSSAHGKAGRVLAGPGYALVDPSLAALRRPVGPRVGSVLVASGAADAAGVGARIAADLVALLPDAAVRLVVGRWSSDAIPEGVEAVRTDGGLGDQLAAADLVVTAGGVTLLESLLLARPTVAFTLADNQRRAVAGAVEAGAAAGGSIEGAAAEAARLAADDGARTSLSAAAGGFVDGRGAARVAAAIAALLAPASPEARSSPDPGTRPPFHIASKAPEPTGADR